MSSTMLLMLKKHVFFFFFSLFHGQKAVETYLIPLRVHEGPLDRIERNQRPMFEIMRKTQRFDVFLQPWRYLTLVAPVPLPFEVGLQLGIDVLHFA